MFYSVKYFTITCITSKAQLHEIFSLDTIFGTPDPYKKNKKKRSADEEFLYKFVR